MNPLKIHIEFQPYITDDQLWDFYVRNDICETGFGKENAVLPLHHPCVIVGAFYEDKLVGYARALFDGLSAAIVEFCLECQLQGDKLIYSNGSIIEKDTYGIGKRIGELLIDGLRGMGNTYISVSVISGNEEAFYTSLALHENKGHRVYILDERPYISY